MTMSAATRRRGWRRKQKRLVLLAGFVGVIGLATAMVLVALREQIVFFYSPSDIMAQEATVARSIRIGGLVKEGSWLRDGQENVFAITDGFVAVTAHYTGLLPDLFREGQGVVAEGSLQSDGVFLATNVLARHDENYIPKEVVDALRQSGEWRPGNNEH